MICSCTALTTCADCERAIDVRDNDRWFDDPNWPEGWDVMPGGQHF